MKIVAPNYYNDFTCLMGDCRHSCCIGWEIDIDEDSLSYYQNIPGEIGKRLSENIAQNEDSAYFRLTSDERCPFLNASGLCDLILTLGEDSLCQICADHPRFRNYFSDRIEIGLGLCCEAAAKLILCHEAPVELSVIGEDNEDEYALLPEESELLRVRSRLIQIMQDRSMPIEERVQHMLDEENISLPTFSAAHWVPFLLQLERLDESWAEHLRRISDHPSPDREWEIPFEQLMVYLLYRHLPSALEDGDLHERIAFCVTMWQLVRALACAEQAEHGRLTMENLIELARLYSSEIEYSDENIIATLDSLREFLSKA